MDFFKFIKYSFVVFLVVYSQSCGFNKAETFSTKFEPSLTIQPDSLSATVESYYKKLEKYRFNGAILAAHNGKIIFREHNGYSDIRKKVPLIENSVFQLASVSKQFTSVAILQLYEKGLLNLTDSITKYYSGFPYKGVTIKNLLHQRSGLPEYHYFPDSLLQAYFPLNNQKLMAYMAKYKPDKYYLPNRRFNYCNTNYAVLAAIVEKVSKQQFPEYMQRHIFDKLKMKHTFIYQPAKRDSFKNLTYGHKYYGRKDPDNYLDDVFGDKGVMSCVNDLFIWNEALMRNKILKKATKELAWQAGNKKSKFYKQYGMGWRIWHLNNGKNMIYHAGWWHGYNTLNVMLAHENFSLIILSNKHTKLFFGNYRMLINELFPGSFNFYVPEKPKLKSDSLSVDSTMLVQVI